MATKIYYAAHAEDIRAKARARISADPEPGRSLRRVDHIVNLERDHARDREYHRKHRERRLQYMRAYYLANKWRWQRDHNKGATKNANTTTD